MLLFASCTTAQAQILQFETSEGNFSVELFDEPAERAHPDVAAHIAEFRRRNPPGTNMAFHHSDVLTCEEADLDECFFFCECVDERGVCDGDPDGEVRACDPIGAFIEVDGEDCTCIGDPIIGDVCEDDESRTCDPDETGDVDGDPCDCIETILEVCKAADIANGDQPFSLTDPK